MWRNNSKKALVSLLLAWLCFSTVAWSGKQYTLALMNYIKADFRLFLRKSALESTSVLRKEKVLIEMIVSKENMMRTIYSKRQQY